jgi:hypothetical protein
MFCEHFCSKVKEEEGGGKDERGEGCGGVEEKKMK